MTTTKSVLATLLVLGSSTAAFARPTVRDHREARVQTVSMRDHRTASSYRDHQNFGRGGDRDDGPSWGDRDGDHDRDNWSSWTTLASSALVGGAAQIYPSTDGRFQTLQLTADRGDTYVSKLVIQYGDYTRQTITVNREIEPGSAITVDLAGGERAIHSIVVVGSERPGACFSVQGA